jgi:hypothetical protein
MAAVRPQLREVGVPQKWARNKLDLWGRHERLQPDREENHPIGKVKRILENVLSYVEAKNTID